MNWQLAVQGTVAGLGYELVDAQRSAGGLLRVFIDKPLEKVAALPAEDPARFITVDDCERVTRQLQHVLEVEGCDYERLEVSSPGLDRPLKKPADFERFAGEQIELTLKLPLQGRKKFRGELRVGESGWQVVMGEEPAQQALDFVFEDVREAHLVPMIDFKGRRGTEPAEEKTSRPAPKRSAGTATEQGSGTAAGGRQKSVQGERRQ
jgi:ribosome maturation factor RimP